MQIRKAQRKKARIKMAIQGPSGSGKTYSSLLLAQGLSGDLSKVCVIDTENNSADLYAHLGEYNVINLQAPYTPEKYIQAVELAEEAQMEIIIIDSLSHGWEYLLEYHSNLTGNSFSNWGKVTPRQRSLVTKILSSDAHVIATMRVKQDYVLTENQKGKLEPQKVGLKAIQRDGVDYEFTLVFELDNSNFASVSKDRTGQFWNQPDFKISVETGKQIREWCEEGVSVDQVKKLIAKTKTLQELTDLYKQYPAYLPLLKDEFSERKEQLANNIISPFKTNPNGIHHH
jgi:nucleoside-triphosphatase THEP1